MSKGPMDLGVLSSFTDALSSWSGLVNTACNIPLNNSLCTSSVAFQLFKGTQPSDAVWKPQLVTVGCTKLKACKLLAVDLVINRTQGDES
jgi:hypothetical protein